MSMFKSMVTGTAPQWREVSEPFYRLLLKSFGGLTDAEISAGAGVLSKGAGHKYIRRVPAGVDKKGRKRFRYFYRVTGGHGLAHDNEIVEGAALSLSTVTTLTARSPSRSRSPTRSPSPPRFQHPPPTQSEQGYLDPRVTLTRGLL